jgi:hypothetical protein
LPEAYDHATGVIDKPSFFTMKDFQDYLNNPLLLPEWVHVKKDGMRVELEKSGCYKLVQNRKLQFMDKEVLNNAIDGGCCRGAGRHRYTQSGRKYLRFETR